MKFLQRITSFCIAILLLIFLNNMMAFIFPQNAASSSNIKSTMSPYTICQDKGGYYNGTAIDQTKKDAYNKCIIENTQTTNDEKALRFQSALLKAVVVLILIVGIAILMFKKFPYFATSLIAGGLLFALYYPSMAQFGSLGEFVSSGSLSEGVQTQLRTTKFVLDLLGLVALSLADILFFEKHKEAVHQPQHEVA
ncbi:MAG: hypothetical protein AAB942_00115 [Patescibacteria group bacterium]